MLVECALAVLASGKPINRENLLAMCSSVGFSPKERDVCAILLLSTAITRSVEERIKPSISLPFAAREESAQSNHPVQQPAPNGLPGRYIYGVVRSGHFDVGSLRGVQGRPVRLISAGTIGAIVHDSPAEPYVSDEAAVVGEWAEAHNAVLTGCMAEFGAVVPFTFNTILYDPEGKEDPDEIVRRWLNSEHASLEALLSKLDGKVEYGVQVFWDMKTISEQIAQEDPGVQDLRNELVGKSVGRSFMLKQKMERLLKDKIEAAALAFSQSLIDRLRLSCCDVRVDKVKKVDSDVQMIANLNCLVARGEVQCIEEVVADVLRKPGCDARITGPWPAYSFVV